MGLKTKSIQNRDIANLAYGKKYYDVACSRYYYFMLQYLIYTFEAFSYTKRKRIRSKVRADFLLRRKSFPEGTHIQMMYYYKYLLQSRPQLAQNFQNLFTSIKSLRVTADYHSTTLSAQDVEIMIEQIKKLKKIVDECIIERRRLV